MQHRFTPSGISEAEAEKLTTALQHRLYSLTDLALTLKHVHWNVVGPGFIAVHEMLDDHVEEVRLMVDDLAERITTLGGIANGLAGGLVRDREWNDYALGRAVVPAHLGALDKVYDGIIGDHRRAMGIAEDLDLVSHDMLVEQTGKLELFQWFVRAHLENTAGELPTADEEGQLDAAAAAALADHL
ncbi:MAG: DNA starvation/stationary phase protection protein [Acidimicrobiia bacterium]|nr:DNA starvation/stationary phase protection protein [Acidimicrobiia bacterium]